MHSLLGPLLLQALPLYPVPVPLLLVPLGLHLAFSLTLPLLLLLQLSRLLLPAIPNKALLAVAVLGEGALSLQQLLGGMQGDLGVMVARLPQHVGHGVEV